MIRQKATVAASVAISICCMVGACAHPGIQPDKVTVQTVNIPVATPCSADPGVKPDLADPKAFAAAVAAAPTIFEVATVYASGLQQLFDWTARVEAANAGCRAPVHGP